jgi:hypothetical protein
VAAEVDDAAVAVLAERPERETVPVMMPVVVAGDGQVSGVDQEVVQGEREHAGLSS